MIFTTVQYVVFFAFVFFVYWHLGRRQQNLFLLLASYYFYASWDWRFLSLIIASTLIDYLAGPRIHRATSDRARKAWLAFSLIANLGILGYFKYYNFFADSLVALGQAVGWPISRTTADIILPVGISFYTFQSLSYSIDIYQGRLEPTRSLLDFATFVAFFPQLVAGPIVRAREFLYQLEAERRFTGSDLERGLARFLLGFFKKAFVADTLAIHLVDPVFAQPEAHATGILWLALLGYTVQVYADFSGYSSMAIGSARMLGFKIPENFAFPFLSLNISEFWRRWHISMSSFFRDYVYIGLGGNRGSALRTTCNLAATTVVSGLWHGAAWTYVIFGGLWGLYFVFLQLWRRLRGSLHGLAALPLAVRVSSAWLLTQFGFFISLCLFRSPTFSVAGDYLKGMFQGQGGISSSVSPLVAVALLSVFVDHLSGWLLERHPHLADRAPLWARGVIYAAMVIFLHHAVPRGANPFVYFQF